MALAVLVIFDDDNDALNFVEIVDEKKSFMYTMGDIKAPAIYKFPTMYHAPFDTHGGKKTEVGWTKGQKYGWWVCGTCRKPSQMYWDSVVHKESSFGKNIKSMYFTEEETSD